jgi:hypothetical protein
VRVLADVVKVHDLGHFREHRMPISGAVAATLQAVEQPSISAARRALSLTVAVTNSSGIPDRWTQCGLAGLGSIPGDVAVYVVSKRAAGTGRIAPGPTRPTRQIRTLATPAVAHEYSCPSRKPSGRSMLGSGALPLFLRPATRTRPQPTPPGEGAEMPRPVRTGRSWQHRRALDNSGGGTLAVLGR